MPPNTVMHTCLSPVFLSTIFPALANKEMVYKKKNAPNGETVEDRSFPFGVEEQSCNVRAKKTLKVHQVQLPFCRKGNPDSLSPSPLLALLRLGRLNFWLQVQCWFCSMNYFIRVKCIMNHTIGHYPMVISHYPIPNIPGQITAC